MRSLLEHGGEAEELALCGFIDENLLVLLVNGGEPDRAGDHDVSASAGVAHFVNTLPWREVLYFNLTGQYGSFIVVEQGEKWDLAQDLRITGHGASGIESLSD